MKDIITRLSFYVLATILLVGCDSRTPQGIPDLYPTKVVILNGDKVPTFFWLHKKERHREAGLYRGLLTTKEAQLLKQAKAIGKSKVFLREATPYISRNYRKLRNLKYLRIWKQMKKLNPPILQNA